MWCLFPFIVQSSRKFFGNHDKKFRSSIKVFWKMLLSIEFFNRWVSNLWYCVSKNLMFNQLAGIQLLRINIWRFIYYITQKFVCYVARRLVRFACYSTHRLEVCCNTWKFVHYHHKKRKGARRLRGIGGESVDKGRLKWRKGVDNQPLLDTQLVVIQYTAQHHTQRRTYPTTTQQVIWHITQGFMW